MKDLQVIDVDPNTRQVFFSVKPRFLTGISKLVQIVVLSLLTDPEQDVFDPEKGSGIPGMIGMNISPKDSTIVFAELSQRIKKVESEIMNDQMDSSDVAEERLREIEIKSIENGVNIDEILVKLRVINQSNQAMDIMV